MSPLDCRQCALLLLDFHFETLEPVDRARVSEHLLSCTDCRATLEKLKARVPDQLGWPDEEPPKGLAAKVIEQTATEVPAPAARMLHEETVPPPSPARLWRRAAAVAGLAAAAAWGISVQQKEVRLAASVDGQEELAPGGLTTLRASIFDVGSGRPIDGADVALTLRGPDGKQTVIYRGPSDAHGTVAGSRVPDLPEGGYTLELVAEKGGETTRLTREVKVLRRFKVLLSTDKPSYQPGQTVHARALVREAATNKPPKGAELQFVMADSKANKVGRSAVKVDEFGVAAFDFALADEILEGTWRLEAALNRPAGGDGGAASSVDLTVGHYVLPKFAVKVTTDKPFYKPGETVSGHVEARYFFGKPVANAKVKVVAGVFVDRFRPVAEASGVADRDGTWGFELPLPRALPGLAVTAGSAAIDLAVDAKDEAGEGVEKHLAVTVASEALSVSVVPEGGALVPNVENRLLALVVRPDGEPVKDALVRLPLEPGATPVKTGEDGIAVLTVRPTSLRRDVGIVVRAPDGAELSKTVEVKAEALPAVIRLERSLYKAGETMKGEVLATSPTGTLYLDLARDGATIATQTAVIDGGKAAFAFDLPAEAAGSMTLYAYTPGREVKRAQRTVFVAEPRELKITFDTEFAAGSGQMFKDHLGRPRFQSARPGTEATIKVQVAGEDGKPARASVGLAVVDESVFALAAKEPALLKAYFLLAEELARPGFQLDPAQAIASRQDRAATLLFSRPHDSEIRRVAETSSEELSARQMALVGAQTRASHMTWGFGILLLGVLFEGAVRFAFEKLLGGFFKGKWWRTGALAAGGALALLAKLDGSQEPETLMIGVAPLVAVLALEAVVWLVRGQWLTAGAVLGAMVVAAVFITTVFGQNLRAMFAASASALGGDDAALEQHGAFGGSRKELKKRFFAGDEGGGGGVAVDAPAPAPNEPALFAGRAKADVGALEGAELNRLEKVRTDTVTVLKGATAEEKASVRVRSWFPETMFWTPSLVTGEDGLASIRVPVADSITSWRISGVASAADGRLGTGQGALKVFQDFFVDIDVPVALTVGDEVELPIAVHNYLSEPQVVKVELDDADWLTALSPRVQELSLAPGEVKGAPMRIRATGFGKKALTVYAFGTKLKDAVKREVEVRPDGVRVESSVGGPLAGAVTATTKLPAGAIAGTEKVLLRVYPGMFAAALDGLDGLLRMPAGCFEQTSSTTFPNALVLAYLRETGKSKPELELKATEYLQQGYQRLLSFEVAGGGFEWFGRAPANQVLTAYGLLEFAEMAKVYAVDPEVIRRTQEWLLSRQLVDGSWDADRASLSDGLYRDSFHGKVGATAYVTWALLESGYRGAATDRALAFLRGRFAQVSDGYTRALVANALLANGDERSAQAMLATLESAAIDVSGKLRFPAGGQTAVFSSGTAADAETTALVVTALSRAHRSPDKTAAALDWLLSARSADGSWGSTQATVLALRALLDSASATPDDKVHADVAVKIGEATAGSVQLRPETSDLVQTVDLTAFARPGQPLAVTLETAGAARAQYQLVTLAYVPKPAEQEALALSVDFDRVTLAPDDTLTAKVKATWKRDTASGMVMLTLGVPPGFSVDTESVARLYAQGRIGKFTVTGRELLLYVDRLQPHVTTELAYKLRARYPVKAKAPSSLAYLYYQPDVRAESKPFDVLVR